MLKFEKKIRRQKVKLRMGRLEEIWNKYEEMQDRLEVIDVIFLNMMNSGLNLKLGFTI